MTIIGVGLRFAAGVSDASDEIELFARMNEPRSSAEIAVGLLVAIALAALVSRIALAELRRRRAPKPPDHAATAAARIAALAPDDADAPRVAAAALRDAISARLGVPAAAMTVDELRAAGVEGVALAALEAAREATFAPGRADPTTVRKVLDLAARAAVAPSPARIDGAA